jgi:uncharacterized protein (DUF2384 family)
MTVEKNLPPIAAEAGEVTARLVEMVQVMVAEAGDPEAAHGFNARDWLKAWLSVPNRALGGVRPSTCLNRPEGQEMVATLLARMQSGAYS